MRSISSNKDIMHIDEADLRKFKQMQNVGKEDRLKEEIKRENKQKQGQDLDQFVAYQQMVIGHSQRSNIKDKCQEEVVGIDIVRYQINNVEDSGRE